MKPFLAFLLVLGGAAQAADPALTPIKQAPLVALRLNQSSPNNSPLGLFRGERLPIPNCSPTRLLE